MVEAVVHCERGSLWFRVKFMGVIESILAGFATV